MAIDRFGLSWPGECTCMIDGCTCMIGLWYISSSTYFSIDGARANFMEFISEKCHGSDLGILRKYTVGSRFELDSFVFSIMKSST